jgi:hypothetical protein
MLGALERKKMKALIKKAVITNNTNYDPDLCRNGGHYSFWQKLEYVGETEGTPAYRRSFHTSADFEYCSMCGNFGSCSCEDYDLLSIEQVQELIDKANSNPSPKIFAEVEMFENEQYQAWMVLLKCLITKEIEIASINQVLTCASALEIDLWEK